MSSSPSDAVKLNKRVPSNNTHRIKSSHGLRVIERFIDVSGDSETFDKRLEEATLEWSYGKYVYANHPPWKVGLRRHIYLSEVLWEYGIYARDDKVAETRLRATFLRHVRGNITQHKESFKLFTYKDGVPCWAALRKLTPTALEELEAQYPDMFDIHPDIKRFNQVELSLKWEVETAEIISKLFAKHEAKEGAEMKVGTFVSETYEYVDKYLRDARGTGCCKKTIRKLCKLKIDNPTFQYGYTSHRGNAFLSANAEYKIATEVQAHNVEGIPVFKEKVIQWAKILFTTEHNMDGNEVEWNNWYYGFVKRTAGYFGKLNVVEKSREDWCTPENLLRRYTWFAEDFIEIGYAKPTPKFEEYMKRQDGDSAELPFGKEEEWIHYLPDFRDRIFNIDETQINGLIEGNRRELFYIPYNDAAVHALHAPGTEQGILKNVTPPVQRQVLKKVATTQSQKQNAAAVFSMMACVSMSGKMLAPSFSRRLSKMTEHVCPRDECSKIDNLLVEQEPTYYSNSKGSFDGQLFFRWFQELFLPAIAALDAKARKEKKVIPETRGVLIMDSCPSHFMADFLELARKERIKVYCLVPYTTHVCQTLDVTLFAPFKRHFNKYLLTNTTEPGEATARDVIEQSIASANATWGKTDLIETSWKVVGLYPFTARPYHEQKEKTEREAALKDGVSLKRKCSPLSSLSNSPDAVAIRDFSNITLTPENSNSSNKEDIDVAALMSRISAFYQAFLPQVRQEFHKEEVDAALIRRVMSKLKEFDPSSCIAEQSEQSRKRSRALTTGAEVYLNHRGEATKQAFVASQREKEEQRAAKQRSAEALKAQRVIRANARHNEYKKLREDISKHTRNGSMKLTGKMFNLLWSGLMTDSEDARQAFDELKKRKVIKNTQQMATSDILSLIEQCDKTFFNKIKKTCCWKERSSAQMGDDGE